jgi:predicted DCC family thiol-disulfide oxidoreductase YuxK
MELMDQGERRLSRQACLLVYDGECRLCVSTKMALERRGVDQARTGVKFVAYQSEMARIALGQRYRLGRPETAFFVQPSGEVLHGLDAFPPVLPHLPGGTLVLWGLRLRIAHQLVEWGYRLLARHRYQWFGIAQPTR